MNFNDWYTDRMDVYRTMQVKEDALTRKERSLVLSGINCRIYRDGGGTPAMKQTAADMKEHYKLACDNSVKIASGDELIITIGGRLGHADEIIRAFAGSCHHYYEPYGAIAPQLAHQEIDLMSVERI